jgi:hypothetical protein
MVLGPIARVLTPERPLRAPGPFNELCLQVPGDYQLGDHSGASANWWGIRLPGGQVVSPSVTLVAPDGRREQYPRVGFLFGEGQWVCFETRPPRDTRRRYVRVELSADHPFRVLKIPWERANGLLRCDGRPNVSLQLTSG